MISILDQPIDVDRFSERIRHAVAEILDFDGALFPGSVGSHLPCGRPTPSSTSTTTSVTTALQGRYRTPALRPRHPLVRGPLRPHPAVVDVHHRRRAREAVAPVLEMHHSITDGVGALRLSEKYLDLTRDAEFAVEVDLDAVIAGAIAAEEAADRAPMGYPQPKICAAASAMSHAARLAGPSCPRGGLDVDG